MYILNNIHNRNYNKEYQDINNVIFDISEKQLTNVKNKDWNDISKGNVVCIVKSSKKISTFFVVDSNIATGIVSPEDGETYVLTGHVIAKLQYDESIFSLFNKHGVSHPYLPNNKFSIGCIVANIGNSLDNLSVKIFSGVATLGDVAANHA